MDASHFYIPPLLFLAQLDTENEQYSKGFVEAVSHRQKKKVSLCGKGPTTPAVLTVSHILPSLDVDIPVNVRTKASLSIQPSQSMTVKDEERLTHCTILLPEAKRELNGIHICILTEWVFSAPSF